MDNSHDAENLELIRAKVVSITGKRITQKELMPVIDWLREPNCGARRFDIRGGMYFCYISTDNKHKLGDIRYDGKVVEDVNIIMEYDPKAAKESAIAQMIKDAMQSSAFKKAIRDL